MNIRAEIVGVTILLVILGSILFIPHLFHESIIGDHSYYHLRHAEQPLASYDQLSYGGKKLFIQPYALIISGIHSATALPLEQIGIYLPILLVLIILLLFYIILRTHNLGKIFSASATILLALSPPIFYLANTITTHTIVLLLILIAYLLYVNHKEGIATIVIILIPLFGIYETLLAITLLIIYSIKTKKYPLFTMLLILLIGIIPYIIYGIPKLPPGQLTTLSFLQTLMKTLGWIISYSIFAIILTYFGLKMLWKEKYKHLSIYLLIIALTIFAIIKPLGVVYLALPIAILSALGLSYLLNNQWKSPILQHIITGIILLGIIISSLLYIQNLGTSEPTKEIIEAFNVLNQKDNSFATIASHPDNGHWISSIGYKKNVMDTVYTFAPNPKERLNDLKILFYTKDFEETTRIINKYDIKYIYIDKDMKEGQVWTEENEGLLFFLTASNKFKNVYKGENIEIWSITL